MGRKSPKTAEKGALCRRWRRRSRRSAAASSSRRARRRLRRSRPRRPRWPTRSKLARYRRQKGGTRMGRCYRCRLRQASLRAWASARLRLFMRRAPLFSSSGLAVPSLLRSHGPTRRRRRARCSGAGQRRRSVVRWSWGRDMCAATTGASAAARSSCRLRRRPASPPCPRTLRATPATSARITSACGCPRLLYSSCVVASPR
mmetsp:Transcript_7974/g.28442  ORF Transcript_7974/g.28442 Transcript_7974/m.28442 type:complete len:202 (-) Transcript_7974:1699-2304(-)